LRGEEFGLRSQSTVLSPFSFLLASSSPRHATQYIEVYVRSLLLAGLGFAIVRPLASTVGGEFLHFRGGEG
jgi:hypothetical protein